MFIAMNRFKITKGFEAGFEEVWRQRDSYLHTVEGFKSFSLLKGGEFDDYTTLRVSYNLGVQASF